MTKSLNARASADDDRAASREQLRRAEALVGEFRANVRADLRSHLAHGGSLAASIIDDLSRALDDASRALTQALRR